jgi:hypothetical protein
MHAIASVAAVEAASVEDGVLAASTIIGFGAAGKEACSPPFTLGAANHLTKMEHFAPLSYRGRYSIMGAYSEQWVKDSRVDLLHVVLRPPR